MALWPLKKKYWLLRAAALKCPATVIIVLDKILRVDIFLVHEFLKLYFWSFLGPAENKGNCLFHQYSCNSEVETTWISWICWPLGTSIINQSYKNKDRSLFQWIVFQCIFIEPNAVQSLIIFAIHSTFTLWNNDLTKFMHEVLGTQVDGSPQKGFKMVHSVRTWLFQFHRFWKCF